MDIDENTGKSQQQQDIESSFLRQFSCLGTTDHDELVGQLQKLLGNNITYPTARFFLDMNDWNLQAAVGFYFDYYSGEKLPSMQLLAEVNIKEGESVKPNTRFTQTWKVLNNGEEIWPSGCYLKLISLPNIVSDYEKSLVPIVPGESTLISAAIISPSELGSYQLQWRLCTPNGSFFGDSLWTIVTVTEHGTLGGTQQVSEFRNLELYNQSNSLVISSPAQQLQIQQIQGPLEQHQFLQQQQQQQQQVQQQQQQQQTQDDNEMC